MLIHVEPAGWVELAGLLSAWNGLAAPFRGFRGQLWGLMLGIGVRERVGHTNTAIPQLYPYTALAIPVYMLY